MLLSALNTIIITICVWVSLNIPSLIVEKNKFELTNITDGFTLHFVS